MTWEPDDQLVPAVLARHRPLSGLSQPDRCWAVAGLTLAGLTAEDIAERLGCSLRLVRSIRAEAMTQVCAYVQRETHAFTDELRLARSELSAARRSAETAEAEAARLRTTLVRLTEAPSVCQRGHVLDRYNSHIDRHGHRRCRACHRERQATYYRNRTHA